MIKQTWTYNHKTLIVALALSVALVYPHIPNIPTLHADTVTYTSGSPQTLQDMIEKRTKEIYTEHTSMYLEESRQEAIQEYGQKLLALSATSTYVDYQALRQKYGY